MLEVLLSVCGEILYGFVKNVPSACHECLQGQNETRREIEYVVQFGTQVEVLGGSWSCSPLVSY
eukprot:477566-Amphidinium_carterae.1